MANALSEIVTGKIPNDRIALKVLWEEMSTWPALDIDRQKQNESVKGHSAFFNKSLTFLQ